MQQCAALATTGSVLEIPACMLCEQVVKSLSPFLCMTRCLSLLQLHESGVLVAPPAAFLPWVLVGMDSSEDYLLTAKPATYYGRAVPHVLSQPVHHPCGQQ